MVKAVPLFSPLEYIMAIAKDNLEVDQITDDEILSSLCETRRSIELGRLAPYDRIILSHAQDLNYWKKKYEKRALQTRRILLRWKLLEQTDGEKWKVTQDLKKIGRLYTKFKKGKEKKDLEMAQRVLLNRILHAEQPFRPSRFLMNIRNSALKEIEIKIKYKGKMHPLKGETAQKTMPIEHEGVAYSTENFVREIINSNFRSFDIMRTWGKFFEITNWYRVKMPSTQEVEVLSPKYGIYLTRHLMTYEEAKLVIEFIQQENKFAFEKLRSYLSDLAGHPYNTYSVQSILNCLNRLGLVTNIEEPRVVIALSKFDLKTTIEIALRRGELVLAEAEKSYVHFDYFNEIDEMKTYFLVSPYFTPDSFYKTLKKAYNELIRGPAQHFVSIPLLRERTCLLLRINDQEFDRLLTHIAGKKQEKLYFSKLPLRFAARKLGAKFGEGIVINNILYHYLSIEKD